MKEAWKPNKKEIRTSLFILAGSVALFTVIQLTEGPGVEGKASLGSAILMGLFGGFSLWLALHLFVLWPMKFIPIITARTDEKGKLSGRSKVGAFVFQGLLWGYLFIFLVGQRAGYLQSGGDHLALRWVGIIVVLWLSWGTAKGIAPPRHIMAYLLVLHGLLLYRLPDLAGTGWLEWLYVLQMLLGLFLGLALIFSRHVGAYLSQQYMKLPEETRDRLESKGS